MTINYYKQGNSIVKTIGVLDLQTISESEYNDLMSKAAEKIDGELAAQQPSPAEPTTDERIAALEDELAATKILLGLEE